MRKIRAYLLAGLLAVSSCINPLTQTSEETSSYPEGAQVTVNFTVAAEGIAPTKAQQLGEDKPLDNLYLAVFGSSGYLKEYVEATPGGVCGSIDFPDPYDQSKKTQVILYSFSAKLTLSDSKRIIHFIGNGPRTISFGYADAVLSSLLSTSGERAYWQMMEIDGIRAKTSTSSYTDDNGRSVEIGDYIDSADNKIVDGKGYVISDSTQDAFKQIPLVRNWAKIVVEADTKTPEGGTKPNNPFFTPISYAVVHVPDRGTLAPHSSATGGFIQDYQKKTYFDIVNLGYPANLPPDATIDDSIPAIDDFKYWDRDTEGHGEPSDVAGVGWRNGVAPAGEYGAVYLYERPVPTDQLPPTFVIVYGEYDNPEDQAHKGKYFYKIDLMTDHKYYPVFRNFQYRILIHSILAPGHATPVAAAAAAGSADVSADINARHLPDISDGFRRLAVRPWMAKTFTNVQPDNTELSVYFMSDVSSGVPDLNPESVSLELLPMKFGVDQVITEVNIDEPVDDQEDESYGWRTIHFKTTGGSNTIRSQTLRISATSGGETLYRDVVITVEDIQPMVVSCSDRRIKAQKGTPVDLYIDIPDGLTESMFPLQFEIEPEAMTLSPNNDNLPVTSGLSLSGSGKKAFHFIRTLNWEDYLELETKVDASDKLWRRIVCHFISNRDISATTIWVKNDTYFNPASTTMGNFGDKTFRDLHFLEPIKANESGQVLTLEFDVDRDPEIGLPAIDLALDGLIPLDPPADFAPVSDVEFRFTPTESHVTLKFLTADASGEVYLSLNAEDYESQSLRTHHFTLYHGIGFFDGHNTKRLGGWSNVVNGRINMEVNKNVLFGYYDDPEALNPTISLESLVGLNQKFPSPSEYPWTPTGPHGTEGAFNYHELEFQTAKKDLYQDISFLLSSPGYLQVPVLANRFNGNILTYQQNGLTSKNVTGEPLTHSYKEGIDCTVEFAGNFRAESNGIFLDPGQTGMITLTNTDPEHYKFFYVQFNVANNGGIRRFPKMDPIIPEGSTFDKYPGNNDQCIWLLPLNTENASITLTAEDDYATQISGIVVKTFKAN